MGSEGFQISIPDFDDDGDDYNTKPVFGRSGAAGLWGDSSNSALDSPSIQTPTAHDKSERSYFHHSRGDSVASEDSATSVQLTSRKLKAPFIHSAQSSVATTSSSPFTKKGSFASLRNAFKSSKNTEPAPPVPALDQLVYPALKNPFNRSTSSLAHIGPNGRPAAHPSPRPSTPASGETKYRGTPKSKGHTSARSQHSASGSIFHFSDGGSDHGHGGFSFSSPTSPPPVPPFPNAFGHHMMSSEPLSPPDFEDRNIPEARTPSDFALHAIFIRFATLADSLINKFVSQPIDRDPLLDSFMGPGIVAALDEVLRSFEKIAQKHAQQVVDSIRRWPKAQIEMRGLTSPRTAFAKASRGFDSSATLAERKALASVYLMCRALIAATQSMTKDSLSDVAGNSLEEFTFEQFRKPDIKMLTHSVNHRAIAELYAVLLGNLANIRFESVTDRFLTELSPIAAGQVPKDSDFKYENLVKGLKHLQIKVWPPERFEEGAEFLESLSKSFDHAHGIRLKSIFAETLVYILHPIGKTAQAEVNHPEWAKAIELIYPKAKDMMSKPRYWQVAYPLVVSSLCVAPHEYFLKHWQSCFEAGIGKMKEKPYRMTVLNGAVRLLWTYLYRCHEPGSTVTMKLENLMKSFFPPNRITIVPQEDRMDPFVYMVHFILSRQPEYGSELCLELLQERALSVISSSTVHQLGPERFSIAVQAILLSVHLLEKEENSPAWPSSADFSQPPAHEDYPMSTDFLPSPPARQSMADLLERCSKCVCAVASTCYQSVGIITIFNDQYLSSQVGPTYEEASTHVVRQLPEGTFAYPQSFVPHVNVLQACFHAWPRCLHSSLTVENALDMLINGVVHVEPAVSEVASAALKRFMTDTTHADTVLSRFYLYLFEPQRIMGEGSGLRLPIECARLVIFWLTLLDQWIEARLQQPLNGLSTQDRTTIGCRVEEVEAGSLFLLAHASRTIQRLGAKAIRKLSTLLAHIFPEPSSPSRGDAPSPPRISRGFLGEVSPTAYLNGFEDMLDPEELARLSHWRTAKLETPLHIVESDDTVDRSLWKHVLSKVIQTLTESHSSGLSVLREMVKAAATRYHPYILHFSGVKPYAALASKQASTSSESRVAAYQWFIWMRILCATAQVPDSRPGASHTPRDHSRARSEANVERTDLTSSRDLFKYLSQFLDTDNSAIRDAAVICISSLPAFGYSYLLDDLNVLAARQIFDDPRAKSASTITPLQVGRARRQERFQTTVARIYFLTAHLIQEQRSSGKQTALTHVLKYVRNMQATLSAPEARDAFSLQRLRRYFCGTVERLFEGLATLNDSDRFIPAGMHLALYRLCEEWCQLGKQAEHIKKRLVVMQTAAAKSYQDPTGQAELIQRFQTETRALSHAAAGAMSAIVRKAIFPPDITASPVEASMAEHAKPLEAAAVLDRFTAILASYHEDVQKCGKKGLRSLLLQTPYSAVFADEVLRRAFVTSKDLATSNYRFFDVVAEVICHSPHGFKFSQVVCLGLSNLCHPLVEVRRKAFSMLELVHEQNAGIISLDQYEAAVDSSAPSIYQHAHRLISDILAGEHPDQALNVLSHFAEWIPRVFDGRTDRGSLTLIMLQSLEFWVPHINLMVDDRSGLSTTGRSSIYHLVALTLRYSESHAEQISVLWSRIVDPPYQSNGHAIVRFLLEQSHKVGSTIFIGCAAKIVACLSQSVVGKQLFEELCSIIEPARMLPSIEHKLAHPDAEDIEMWSDLDVLFSEQPRLSLGVAQFSLLFLSDTVMDRYWVFQEQLPIILHALFMHLDHRQPYVRERCLHMLFQLLRACLSGYDELMDRSLYPGRSSLKAAISELERDMDSMLWNEDDGWEKAEPRMRWLVTQVLELLVPLHARLPVLWASLSLHWGTSCSIRPIAFRSLQFYRALTPKLQRNDLGVLIGRTASTLGDDDIGIQEFNVEILLTFKNMAASSDLEVSMVPLLFWCALACLSTTVEAEFLHVLGLLDTLLDRMDLDDPHTADALLSQQPLDWKGSFSMQSTLLTGLRSSITVGPTVKLIQRLTKVQDSRLIDPSEGRVRDLYTLCLPWCLQAMTNESIDNALLELATNIGELADLEERPSITRIMTSFAKSRFRTKDDFLRQSIAALREHYGKEHWTEVVTLLVGLMLNKERMIRVNTLQILKVLFQQRETRAPMDLLGSELLMPLLRLLETDLAPQVLEVLEEPLQISGGPAAKHILRMSMHHHLAADREEVEDVAEVFGIAQESGWCLPHVSLLRDICRSNLVAVFDACKISSRPSRIDFHIEDHGYIHKDSMDNLGDLVQNLHELTSFFEDSRVPTTVPVRQLEARVAAILAKSSEAANDTPQTPFMDVFDLSFSSYEDFEGSSASDTESDLFEFDSPHAL
ncbi:cell morphogenesis N-terminal-domain-containing protein [Cristinia sonorae]|uniref:Cell morphogenesis N-terminal-domain-containing protein n=1 Tax=Cristinia sonorae TaxID=1940300 RepID=A0A8K0XKP1_9AGAR|nr:cell morphogenesis N-terminal-domain-containing protein [Cristinia sonorae]